MEQDIPKRAKAIIAEEVEKEGCRLVRLILFGSRARGDAHPDSDWDFYAVVDREIGFWGREDIASRICRRLAREGIFADVFIRSKKVVQERSGNPGYLTHYAVAEGREI